MMINEIEVRNIHQFTAYSLFIHQSLQNFKKKANIILFYFFEIFIYSFILIH